jgi:hypothetical protein
MSSTTDISIERFKDYLKTGNRQYLPDKNTSFYLLSEFVKIDFDIHKSVTEVRDFHFQDGIEFIGCNLNNGLTFANCEGGGQIKFLECYSNKLDISNTKPGLHFQDIQLDHLSIDSCNFPTGLQIDKKHLKNANNKLSSLSVNNCSFEQKDVILSFLEVSQNMEFSEISKSNSFKFQDIEVGFDLRMFKVEATDIEFFGDSLRFKSNIFLTNTDSNNVKFESGEVSGDLKISEPKIEKELILKGVTIQGKTILLAKESENFHVKLPNLKIESSEFNGGFSFDGDNLYSELITIDFSPYLKGRLVFSNLKLGKLTLKGTNSENNLYFRNMGFQEILIDDFLNLKTLSFSNLDEEFTRSKTSYFKILDSDLGNWELLNFDFNAFSKIIWKDSNIVGLRTSAVGWFSENKFEAEGELVPSTCFRRREFYRQLKQSCEKQGDRINELEFKRRELKAYKKALKIRKEKKIDRFTIYTGGSNNHGQNWIKPIIIVIAFTLFFFYPLMISCVDSELTFWPINSDWKGLSFFWEKYKNYSNSIPELFYLARRSDVLFPEINSIGWFRIWDGLQRIILAFFIFQIVSAFRKFVK